MGNGSRLNGTVVIDTETSSLTQEDIEAAAQVALNSFGQAQQMIVPFQAMKPLIMAMGMQHYSPNPQYEPTPWAEQWKLTKREQRVATLHTVLTKLGALKLSDEEFDEVKRISLKRLKKAQWARKQK